MWCNVLMAILLGIINNINSINFGICIVIMVILSVNPPTLGSKLYLKSPSDRARTITRYTTVLSVVINPAQNVLIKSVGHKYLWTGALLLFRDQQNKCPGTTVHNNDWGCVIGNVKFGCCVTELSSQKETLSTDVPRDNATNFPVLTVIRLQV